MSDPKPAAGDPERAISSLRRALSSDDSVAEMHAELGHAYLAAGWYQEAEACFRDAMLRDPGHGGACAGLGAALLAQGRLRDCRRAYLRSLALKLRARLPRMLRWSLAAAPAATPAQDNAEALYLLGLAKAAAGAFEEAAALLERALAGGFSAVDCHLALASAYSRLGLFPEAAASAQAALRHDPGSAVVIAAISGTLHPWNDAQAESYARKALAIDPDLDAAHANLAAALWGQGKLEEAERHCREALRLRPDHLDYKLNLALILRHAGRLAEAEAVYRSLDPAASGSARLYTELGNLLIESGNFEEARRCLRRAQALGDDARPQLFEATLDLLQGDFAAGWERYEARKRSYDQRWHRTYSRYPEWDGEALGEAGLLVYGEQSLGDQIMFASMLPDVQQRASRVTLLCDPRLETLFSRSYPAIEVAGDPPETRDERIAGLRDIERQIGAGSLGRLFRRSTGAFPRHSGYLVPDSTAVQAWGDRLGALGAGLKVGLSWRGGTQGTGRGRRSISLQDLARALEQPGIRWVSLQHGADGEEIARCAAATGFLVTEFQGVTQDIDSLAALCASLDLVISVCNTNVHVCGAIGKEVWVMAPLVPEWRYGASGERMPWYPSARVLRQERHGDWSALLQEVGRRLRARAQGE